MACYKGLCSDTIKDNTGRTPLGYLNEPQTQVVDGFIEAGLLIAWRRRRKMLLMQRAVKGSVAATLGMGNPGIRVINNDDMFRCIVRCSRSVRKGS
jgi:hypothetical protein